MQSFYTYYYPLCRYNYNFCDIGRYDGSYTLVVSHKIVGRRSSLITQNLFADRFVEQYMLVVNRCPAKTPVRIGLTRNETETISNQHHGSVFFIWVLSTLVNTRLASTEG